MRTFILLGLILMSASPPCLIVTEKDMGETIRIGVGEEVLVKLKGNPTTGYTWETAEGDEAILKQIGEAEFTPDRAAIGAGGTLTLRFKAIGKGTTALRLIYHRPFEKNTPPIKSFQIDVVVQ